MYFNPKKKKPINKMPQQAINKTEIMKRISETVMPKTNFSEENVFSKWNYGKNHSYKPFDKYLTLKQVYSEGLERHIAKIQVAKSNWYDNDKDFSTNLSNKVIPELKQIGRELGIKIIPYETNDLWLEDYMVRLNDYSIYAPNTNFEIKEKIDNLERNTMGITSRQGGAIDFNSSPNYIKNYPPEIVNIGKSYIEGGNVLLNCDKQGQPSAVIGEETIYYTLQSLNLKVTPQNIEKAKQCIANELHLKSENIIYIPQVDFHIDMFYRPLHNGQIAVPDYDMAVEILENNDFGIDEKDKNYLLERINYAREKVNNILKKAEDELIKNNYEIVKIPCFSVPIFDENYWEDKNNLKQINYMNGICGTAPNDKTFFITNSSGYKKLDNYMKKFFKEIGIDKLYFVSTQNLLRFHGGVDCITQEK